MKTHAGRKLSRPTGARQALLRNLATGFLRGEKLRTTYAKAREVSRFTERVLAIAKKRDLVSHRRVCAEIHDKDVRRKVFDVFVPRYQNRPGGCTRVYRIGRRLGDGALMAVVKFVS